MSSRRIFTDCNLSDSALGLLESGTAGHELIQPRKKAPSVLDTSEPDPGFASAGIVLGQPEVEAVLQSANLRWLQIPTAGYTRYDNEAFRRAAKERGLVVTNSSRVYEEACAEHVLSFMLAQARCLPGALGARASSKSEAWHSIRSRCGVLQHQSAVILGYGAIAEKLLRLLAPFDMKVSACRRQARGNELLPILRPGELPAALAQADHVIDILPDNQETRHFFNAARFAQIRPGAVFYNIGRGATVDQSALAENLRPGRLAAAWLDVTDPEPLPDDHPLWALENCHITPHTAGGHQNESETVVRHFLDNFQRFLAGHSLVNRII